jgi:hypothetical protein
MTIDAILLFVTVALAFTLLWATERVMKMGHQLEAALLLLIWVADTRFCLFMATGT